MKFFRSHCYFRIIFVLLGCLISKPVQAIERSIAVVTLFQGEVKIMEHDHWRPVLERNRIKVGSILLTGENGRILLQFRDGSLLRIFENTVILLKSESVPQSSGGRFERKWVLKQGTFFTNQVSGQQHLKIDTPNSFEIKTTGGMLNLSIKEGLTTITVSDGIVKVRNSHSGISLTKGQTLNRVSPRDSLNEKIHSVAYDFRVKFESGEGKKSKKKLENLTVKIQLIRTKSKKDVWKTGPILLTSQSGVYLGPKKLMLNSYGNVQIDLPVITFLKQNPYSDGRVTLMVMMDSSMVNNVVARKAEYQQILYKN